MSPDAREKGIYHLVGDDVDTESRVLLPTSSVVSCWWCRKQAQTQTRTISRKDSRAERLWGGYSALIYATLGAILLVCVALAVWTAIVTWQSNQDGCWRSGYEIGYASDLESAKPAIGLVTHAFTGGVLLHSHGDFAVDPEGQKYVGTPSADVDKAWDALQDGLNIDLDESEIGALRGKTFRWPETGLYFTGLEVFHSLHCLNRLRQALYPDYYTNIFKGAGDPSREMHVGHCINHLRQAIQCHADLTPMQWAMAADGQRIILNTTTQHTCRDFGRIQEWARGRQTRFNDLPSVLNGSLVVVD